MQFTSDGRATGLTLHEWLTAMTKEECLAFCRYYGKENSQSMCEGIEQHWVNATVSNDTFSLLNWVNEVRGHGMEEWYRENGHGIPFTLFGALLSRYLHWSSGYTDGFDRWFYNNYLNEKWPEGEPEL